MIELLTENIVNSICDAIFDLDTKNTLKIILVNGNEININKQFYYHFKNNYLKYDLNETISKAYNIFEHSKQDIIKYKLVKNKLEELNNPLSFFNTNSVNLNGGSVNSSISVNSGLTDNKNTQLNHSKTDNTVISTANVINRGGASQLNEDYKNLELSWKKEDEIYDKISNNQEKKTFDIRLPSDINDINLNTTIVESDTIKLDKPLNIEGPIETPEISYTGININKSLSSGTNISSNTNKSLNSSVAKGTNKSNTINTNINTNKSNTLTLNFIYGDATYKALGLYVSNFKESFLNSFSCLFIEPWTGY